MAGTTVRDQKEVETCFKLAAIESGLKMTDTEITSVQGWSKLYVFQTYWSRQAEIENLSEEKKQENIEHSYSIFKKILENHYRSLPEVMPTIGCLELFSYLKSLGIKIALTTGFYREVVDIILERLGWQYPGAPFVNHSLTLDWSIAGDEVSEGRPAPDMIFTCMQKLHISSALDVINIGDTPSDLESGKRAGVRFSFGLTNGTHTKEQLEGYPNDGLFSSLVDFKTYLEKELDFSLTENELP